MSSVGEPKKEVLSTDRRIIVGPTAKRENIGKRPYETVHESAAKQNGHVDRMHCTGNLEVLELRGQLGRKRVMTLQHYQELKKTRSYSARIKFGHQQVVQGAGWCGVPERHKSEVATIQAQLASAEDLKYYNENTKMNASSAFSAHHGVGLLTLLLEFHGESRTWKTTEAADTEN